MTHGFVRDKHGAIVEFDVPGAANMGPRVRTLQHCSERGGDRILLRPGQRGSRLRARSTLGVSPNGRLTWPPSYTP